MISALLTIIIAGRVKTLKTAFIAGLLVPIIFGIGMAFLSMEGARALVSLVFTIPLNLIAAFLSFKYYERKRQKKRAIQDAKPLQE